LTSAWTSTKDFEGLSAALAAKNVEQPICEDIRAMINKPKTTGFHRLPAMDNDRGALRDFFF
jgi:hypothetical protein